MSTEGGTANRRSSWQCSACPLKHDLAARPRNEVPFCKIDQCERQHCKKRRQEYAVPHKDKLITGTRIENQISQTAVSGRPLRHHRSENRPWRRYTECGENRWQS